MKTIVIYYSYTNNTKGLALKIKNELDCDIFELTPKEPYSDDYDEVVNLGKEEVYNDLRREIKEMPNISDYERIIILTPTWWYKPAPIITTYLKDTDFTLKEVVLGMTNAGWPGTVIQDMANIAKDNGATISNSKEFRFYKDYMVTDEDEFNDWINKLK